MFKVNKVSWIIGCALAVSGCAMTLQSKEAEFKDIEIKPVEYVSHAVSKPKIMYLLGRYYQGKANYKKAVEAYHKALALKPNYVDVHNGLGVIYAMQGQFESALRHFHIALELAPEESHLHNNMGYALLIQNQEHAAMQFFKRALQIDANNLRARKNLAFVVKKLGVYEDVALMKQDTSENFQINAAASTASVKLTMQEPESDLLRIAPNVYTYNVAGNRHSVETQTEHAYSPHKMNKHINNGNLLNDGIEVSNGNGINGMARKVSEYLGQFGADNVRITNHQTFQQMHTEIHYKQGSLAYASRINQVLPNPVATIESDDLRGDIQVKVLLGRDFSHFLGVQDNRLFSRVD